MRLIDADALIEEYPQASGLKLVIENAPTAYDVEKVVAELEELRIDKSKYLGVLNIVAEKYDRANEMLDDAIDIVRGGVE